MSKTRVFMMEPGEYRPFAAEEITEADIIGQYPETSGLVKMITAGVAIAVCSVYVPSMGAVMLLNKGFQETKRVYHNIRGREVVRLQDSDELLFEYVPVKRQ